MADEYPNSKIPLPWRGAARGGGVVRNTAAYTELPYNPELTDRAHKLRIAGNLSEVLLWLRLKKGQVNSWDFDRQKIIGNFIVDFYCANIRLVVEIDGGSHLGKEEYDSERDAYLRGLGLSVLHISDIDIKRNIDGVIAMIRNHPAGVTTPPPAAAPLHGGEFAL
jgi:very-short-patch-repair endonuclease